ncbi:MAG: SlyX family protein, partial [Planktomarina sp.]
VARQDNELLQLRRIVDLLVDRERSRDADAGGGMIIGDERPPHY